MASILANTIGDDDLDIDHIVPLAYAHAHGINGAPLKSVLLPTIWTTSPC